MNKYFVSIGLEIHTAVISNRKMFSDALNSDYAKPNTAVSWLDLGLPGTLPIVNLHVINKAIQLGHFWKMFVNYNAIKFDRKNYFYFDLPKGYQITQYFHPIATEGKIFLDDFDAPIRLIQIQIEEDTAKQIRNGNFIKLDYNRCGAPLLEIVTKPDFHDSQTVVKFLIHLKRTLCFLEISDGKIENGNLRVDVNISLSTDPNKFGTKVEVKNIGSFNATAQAIEYEIFRQTQLLNQNQKIQQETRKWNEAIQQTQFMRQKSDAVGYCFMPEPNIPTFGFSESEYQAIVNQTPVHWKVIQNQLFDKGLSLVDINNLLDHYELYLLFALILSKLNDVKKAYKWSAIEILGQLNKDNIELEKLDENVLNELVLTVEAVEIKKILNSKQAKTVFESIIQTKCTLDDAIIKHNLKQITDINFLENLVQEILKFNQNQIEKFLENPLKFEKFIIGQIMSKTRAQANPYAAKTAYENIAAKLLIKN